MIEVTVKLNDYHEVSMFGDFLQLLDARRELPPVVEKGIDALLAANAKVAEAEEEAARDNRAMLEEIEAKPEKIDAGMMEAAITAYYKANGLAAAKELLAKYGVERVTQIAPERQAEAYAELTV